MDILSHALWAGAAAEVIRRQEGMTPARIAMTVGLGAAPDLVAVMPMTFWSAFQHDSLGLLRDYITATPETEPAVPPLVHALSHHAHCFMHSAVIAGLVTLLLWRLRPEWVPVLVGWWLHIALDIPTHSGDYYPVPFLYPITYWSIEGVDWRSGAVLVPNYAALALVYAMLFVRRGYRSGA